MATHAGGSAAAAPPPYSPPLPATTEELLAQLKLEQLQPIFDRELLTLDALLLCDDRDLASVGVPLGARKLIAQALIPVRQAKAAATPLGASRATLTLQPVVPLPATTAAAAAAAAAAAVLEDISGGPVVASPFEAVELLDLNAQGGQGGQGGRPAGALCVTPALVTRYHGDQVLVEPLGLRVSDRQAVGVWLDPTSVHLRPIGWARLHDLPLTLPSDRVPFSSWDSFLSASAIAGAGHVRRRPATAFTLEQAAPPHMTADELAALAATNKFRPGMRLEARDMMPSMDLICVATVEAVRGPQVLIHFDGWTNKYDYWALHTSTKLFPAGYCLLHGWQLQSPKNYGRPFVWREYLAHVGAEAAPVEAFAHVDPATMFATADVVAGASSVI